MSDTPQTQHAVAYELMKDLLRADGKFPTPKGTSNPATAIEIKAAFQQATELVNVIIIK